MPHTNTRGQLLQQNVDYAMHFVAAGACNVVLRLAETAAADVDGFHNDDEHTNDLFVQLQRELSLCRTVTTSSNVALRLRNRPHSECMTCYTALRAFAGFRARVRVSPELREVLQRDVIPARHHDKMRSASEALCMPDFVHIPLLTPKQTHASSRIGLSEKKYIAAPYTANSSSTIVCTSTDYVVEIKPKSAWVRPIVVGLLVDGERVLLSSSAKLRQCRYSCMQHYKDAYSESNVAGACQNSAAQEGTHRTHPALSLNPERRGDGYCPNMLLRDSGSSHLGLRALRRTPRNNFSLRFCRSSSSRTSDTHQCSSHSRSKNLHDDRGEWRANPVYASSSCTDKVSVLTDRQIDDLATALDESGVWPILSHLQLYGVDPADSRAADCCTYTAARNCCCANRDSGADDRASERCNTRSDLCEDDEMPVLDVELLYRWSYANDLSSVRWLVLPASKDSDRCNCQYALRHTCVCNTVSGGDDEGKRSSIERRKNDICSSPVPCDSQIDLEEVELACTMPWLSLQTCVQRFYVATTARDASIMVAVGSCAAPGKVRQTSAQNTMGVKVFSYPQKEGNNAAVRLNTTDSSCDADGVFVYVGDSTSGAVYRVAVIDLDSKVHKTLQYYRERDASIMRACPLWLSQTTKKR